MKTQLTLLAAAVMLAGCGGSGGSDESLPTYTVSGSVNAHAAQGNEKVCLDLNQDFVCDAGEPTTTANNGSFSFTSASKAIMDAPIVVELDTGATTLSTRSAASTHSAAIDGAILVAPGQRKSSGNKVNVVSTLIAGQVASGDTLDSAVHKVSIQLGKLGLPNEDILSKGAGVDFHILEQNVLVLTSAIEGTERNAQLFSLASKLENYRSFVLEAAPTDEAAEQVLKQLEAEISLRGFNDTGLTQYLADGVEVDQSPADYPGQDAAYGYDQTDGGFKLVKLDATGHALAEDAQEWSCVQDERTGLVWEKKLDNAESPRHFDRLFAYQETGVFEPFIEDINYLGCRDGDDICTTEEYVEYLNEQKVCGITSWRLPTALEVHNLIDFGQMETDEQGRLYGFSMQYFPLQSMASYLEEGVIWTKFNMFSEYSAQADVGGHYFSGIKTRGSERGTMSFVEIYSDKSPADNSDSYQFAARLVADVEAK